MKVAIVPSVVVLIIAFFLVMAANVYEYSKAERYVISLTSTSLSCTGLKPIKVNYEEMAGNYYLQRVLTPNGIATNMKCSSIAMFYSPDAFFGFLQYQLLDRNNIIITTELHFRYDNLIDGLSILATSGNTKVVGAFVAKEGDDYLFATCPLVNGKIMPVSRIHIWTKQRKPSKTLINTMLKKAENMKLDVKNIVEVKQNYACAAPLSSVELDSIPIAVSTSKPIAISTSNPLNFLMLMLNKTKLFKQ